MLTSNEVGDLVGDLVEARMLGRTQTLVNRLDTLITGPRGDALNVLLVLAGTLAQDLGKDPEGGFYRIEVVHLDEDGQVRKGSTLELPDHVATFLQIVVAVAGNDTPMAKDLFMAHVGNDGRRALALLTLAINELATQASGQSSRLAIGGKSHDA